MSWGLIWQAWPENPARASFGHGGETDPEAGKILSVFPFGFQKSALGPPESWKSQRVNRSLTPPKSFCFAPPRFCTYNSPCPFLSLDRSAYLNICVFPKLKVFITLQKFITNIFLKEDTPKPTHTAPNPWKVPI